MAVGVFLRKSHPRQVLRTVSTSTSISIPTPTSTSIAIPTPTAASTAAVDTAVRSRVRLAAAAAGLCWPAAEPTCSGTAAHLAGAATVQATGPTGEARLADGASAAAAAVAVGGSHEPPALTTGMWSDGRECCSIHWNQGHGGRMDSRSRPSSLPTSLSSTPLLRSHMVTWKPFRTFTSRQLSWPHQQQQQIHSLQQESKSRLESGSDPFASVSTAASTPGVVFLRGVCGGRAVETSPFSHPSAHDPNGSRENARASEGVSQNVDAGVVDAAAAPAAATAAGLSVDAEEVAKFSRLAETWWDRDGPHAMLHHMNPTRVSFIRDSLCRHFGRDDSELHPFRGLRILDVGCGGGLLCEPLSRLGATVTGVDASMENIRVAALHAQLQLGDSNEANGVPPIDYLCTSAEDLAAHGRQFDAVVSLEVLEHVNNPAAFVHTLSRLCRPGGAVVMSTINRTPQSFAFAIAGAEYIARLVPKGTHDWSKFVTPAELAVMFRRTQMLLMEEAAGMSLDLPTLQWHLTTDVSTNYIAMAVKAQQL